MGKIKVKDDPTMSKDWVEGLKAGLEVAKAVALKQGYEMTFPEIEEIEIER